MLLIFQPLTLKTKNGTLACDVADGYDTEGTRHRTLGSRCVTAQRSSKQLYSISYLNCFSLMLMEKLICYFLCECRSPQSRLSLFLTRLMTSLVVVGRSLRSPEGVCHCGRSLCRERSELSLFQSYIQCPTTPHDFIIRTFFTYFKATQSE